MELNGFAGPIFGSDFHQDRKEGVPPGFPWAQGHLCANLDMTPANLPLIWAWWTKRPVFHWYDHLAAIFVPSVGLGDAMVHIEALTEFTQKPLNDSNQALSLLNSEFAMMRKVVLQNCMTLNFLITSQGGTCSMIQIECCISIQMNPLIQHI